MNAVNILLATVLTMGVAHAQPVNDAARAALPAAIRQAGVLKVATALQWPPFDFQGPDGTPQGLDIDLVRALAARLGLSPEFTDVKFPAITPAVGNGRFDIGVDEIDDTPERRQTVQLVDYYVAGVQLLVRPGGGRRSTSGTSAAIPWPSPRAADRSPWRRRRRRRARRPTSRRSP